jgi:hypothetical protein
MEIDQEKKSTMSFSSLIFFDVHFSCVLVVGKVNKKKKSIKIILVNSISLSLLDNSSNYQFVKMYKE